MNKNGEEIEFPRVYSERHRDPSPIPLRREYFCTQIYVENIDFLDKALQWGSSHLSSGMLNPASAKRAGGGVTSGAQALEETICRRTNLYGTLTKFTDAYGMYDPHLRDTEVIISSNVSIYRNKDYEPLNEVTTIDVVTAAALNSPELGPGNCYTASVNNLMKRKIRVVLRAAWNLGIKNLLLPAWGCGVFKNPAKEVARCFNEIFTEEEEFQGVFNEVCFAILDDHNANHEFNPRGNFKPFADIFVVRDI